MELFFGKGQILVLGHHRESGGYYYWPEGHTRRAERPSTGVVGACPPIAGGAPPNPSPGRGDHSAWLNRHPIRPPGAAAEPVTRAVFRNGAGEGSRDDDTFRLAVGLLTAADGAPPPACRSPGIPTLRARLRRTLSAAVPEREALAKPPQHPAAAPA